MSPRKTLRYWKREIKELGGRIDSVEQNGHIQIRGHFGERPFLFTVATSPKTFMSGRAEHTRLERIMKGERW